MARPLRIQFPGAFYQVTNRGNERKDIFKDDQDRNTFLELLGQSCATYTVTVHCFVLMNNHFHLLAETPLGNLGEFMRHFNITYTSYFNRQHKRVGHLYQGRYKSFLIDKDNYLSFVSRYIHLNPVKVGVMKRKNVAKQMKYLQNYKWSSLPGYIRKKRRLGWIEYKTIMSEYGGMDRSSRRGYKKQIALDLTEGLPLKNQIVGQSILGSKKFISWVQNQCLPLKNIPEIPNISRMKSYLDKENVFKVISKQVKLSTKELLAAKGTTRNLVMAMLYKFTRMNNRQIGELFGIDYSTVSLGRKHMREEIEKIKKTRTLAQKIEKQLTKIKRNI